MISHQLDLGSKALVITINDNILSTNEASLRQAIFGLFESPPIKSADWNRLVLDLTAVGMIDSVGLNLIVSISQTIKARGGKVTAKVVEGQVHRAFVFTRIDRQVEMTMA
jgi:anti-anti-sigma factor